MSVSILVASPHTAFGELIRLSLEEQSNYQIHLVHTAQDARASFNLPSLRLAIVDYDLQDESFITLCRDLAAQVPAVRLVIIPPDNNPNHPSLENLNPHGFLKRPFYLPDLFELVRQMVSDSTNPASPSGGEKHSAPSWLNDKNLLQSSLEKQVSGSGSVAALFIREGKLQANAGELPYGAALEIAEVMLRYWDAKEQTDLMRYVRLTSMKGDLLAYVTRVVDDVQLILVLEPGASVRLVRPLARQIAQVLAGYSPDSASDVPANEYPEVKVLVGAKNGLSGKEKHLNGSASLAEPQWSTPEPETDLSSEDHRDARLEETLARVNLLAMLGAVPSPDPNQEESRSPSAAISFLNGWTSEPWTDESLAPGETSADPPVEPEAQAASLETVEVEVEPAVEVSTESSPETRLPSALASLEEPPVDPLEDTRPSVLTAIQKLNQLEPVVPVISLLNYTCLLIPRMPHHYLTGELAEQLSQTVQQLCVAFGWRLEGITVRPEYLQWTVQVSPSVSPGNLVRIIRERTSFSIFNTFEYTRQQNPSGDFWAMGYLIISGSQPPSAQLIRDYILKTRERQGILKQ